MCIYIHIYRYIYTHIYNIGYMYYIYNMIYPIVRPSLLLNLSAFSLESSSDHGWLGNPCTKLRFEWENHRKTQGNHRTSGKSPYFLCVLFFSGKFRFYGQLSWLPCLITRGFSRNSYCNGQNGCYRKILDPLLGALPETVVFYYPTRLPGS